MKLYKVLYIGLLLLIYSCDDSQDTIFDKTPSERIEAKKDELKNSLISNPQGWQMFYFPSVENKFSDMERNLIASKDYGILFIQRDFGKGGHTLFMKFDENNEVEMLSDENFNFTREIRKSSYSISQNTYTQLDFTSPNYIFSTGQTSFLFYKKNEDGSLVFTTNKYPQRNREYIVLKPLSEDVNWKNKMQNIYETKQAYENKKIKNLTITDPYGEEIFKTNFSKVQHTDVNLRYSVFVRNMQPHIFNSRYYTGLGSGYLPMENEILFMPGIKVNDSVIFRNFEKEGQEFVSELKGYKAVIN